MIAVMQALHLLRHYAAPWTRTLIDVLLPRACRVCDAPLVGHEPPELLSHWLCPPCRGALIPVEAPFCQKCGEAFDGAADSSFQCTNCAGQKIAFEFAIAGFQTSGPALDLIHRFKYGRDLSLRIVLERMLERSLRDPRLSGLDAQQWCLVPVPLHPLRERERQFNQSRELCHELARRKGLPMIDAMKRSRSTPKQALLTRHQRLENLRGAFEVKRRFTEQRSALRGKSVLLVDDVFTTGATTNECARVLRRDAGVQKVVVISVARG